MPNTLARPPVRDRRLFRQVSDRAFTLIELLTVIAIIAILAAITFGVVKGVNERAAIGQAKAELAVFSLALEAYKRQYGDYPQMSGSDWPATYSNQTRLVTALYGLRGPKGASISGKSFVEMSKFTFYLADSTKDLADAANLATLKFQDPWGRDYFYFYKSSGWAAPSYVLFSVGPNGYAYGTTATPVLSSTLFNADGTLKSASLTDSGAVDNIYAGN